MIESEKVYYSRPGETLEEHIRRVMNGYMQLDKARKTDSILRGIIQNLLKQCGIDEYFELVYQMALDVLKMHDEGKKSIYFAAYIGVEGYEDVKFNSANKEHSQISAYYFLEKCKGIIEEKVKKKKAYLRNIAVDFSYVIAKHHSSLEDYDKGGHLGNIRAKGEAFPEAFYKGYDESVIKFYLESTDKIKITSRYMLIKYLYSILVSSDFLAVHEFKKNKKLEMNVIDKSIENRFVEKLEKTQVMKSIRAYEIGENVLTGVNKYRTEMFLEVEKNIYKFDLHKICCLEAPTGSGKSLSALNASLKLIGGDINKIIYVAPFTNIIEQTYKDIVNMIGENNKDVVSVSSKEEIITEEDDLITDFDVDYMDSLILNYPITVMSHVRMFNMFFGNSRRGSMPLASLTNSVIVLDEIQSYKNKIWISIINMLKEYAEALNIKIVIMSATLPKMNDLVVGDYSMGDLIENREYYYDFFKNRVDTDYSLLEGVPIEREDRIDRVIDKVCEIMNGQKRILIGTITTKTCDDLYDRFNEICKGTDYEVYKIKSATGVKEKNKIIERLKEKDGEGGVAAKKVILVATQSVEAGVDISMDVGFKNIGIIDADEQFCGRIARNFEVKGYVYFYKIDDVDKVYNEDYRAERTLEYVEWRDVLKNKTFHNLYEMVYKRLKSLEMDSYEELVVATENLKFIKVREKMKLIDDDTKVDILVLENYKDDGNNRSVSEDLREYMELSKSDKGYGEKMILLSRFRKIFDEHSISLGRWDVKNLSFVGEFGRYKLITPEELAKIY